MSDHPYPTLLVVEDSDEDFEALSRIMERSCDIDIPIVRCCDGDDALDFLYGEGAYTDRKPAAPPGAVLLDLNLPGTDGRDILTQIKQDEKLKTIISRKQYAKQRLQAELRGWYDAFFDN